MDDMKRTIISSVESGIFFDTLYSIFSENRKDFSSLSNSLIQLHNENHINVLKLYENTPNFSDYNQYPFRRIFESVLPNLDISVPEAISCIKKLSSFQSFKWIGHSLLKSFCENFTGRADQLLEISLEYPDEELNFISSALEAGAQEDESRFIQKMIELTDHKDEVVIQSVISSFGRIEYSEYGVIEQVSDVIIELVKTRFSDSIIANATKSLFNILRIKPSFEIDFLNFINQYKDYHGELYILSLSEILSIENKHTTDKIDSSLLTICSHVKTNNSNAINNIDYTLERLLKSDNLFLCIDFFDTFFDINKTNTSILIFDDFLRGLIENHDTYLSSLVTRWLLSKKYTLVSQCQYLTQQIYGGLKLSVDKEYLDQCTTGSYSTIAKKALGCFFIQPKTAFSLISSIIDTCPTNELQTIKSIIFNPLLISYPKSICESLTILKESENEQLTDFCTSLLDEFEKYITDIDSAGEIKEHRKSEINRHTYWRYHNKLLAKSMKESEKNSPLLSIVSKKIVLYGNKSISYIKNGNNKIRQENEFSKTSHSYEYASLHNINPHNLEIMLQRFRFEGCEI